MTAVNITMRCSRTVKIVTIDDISDNMRTFKEHGKIPDLSIQELSLLIGPIAKANNVTRVYLFGSRARGDYDSDSDYDFLIDVNDEYRYMNYLSFKDTLSELLECDVDVVSRRSLTDNRFSRDIIREGIHVYG